MSHLTVNLCDMFQHKPPKYSTFCGAGGKIDTHITGKNCNFIPRWLDLFPIAFENYKPFKTNVSIVKLTEY